MDQEDRDAVRTIQESIPAARSSRFDQRRAWTPLEVGGEPKNALLPLLAPDSPSSSRGGPYYDYGPIEQRNALDKRQVVLLILIKLLI